MNKRLKEVMELPLPRPEILRKNNRCIHFAVIKDVNVYRQYFYHKSCLERALDFYKDSWRITYRAKGRDAEDAITLMPSIMKQCNKNRHLRAQKFSGVRMCNLSRYNSKDNSLRYITDIVFSDSYTTALFAHRIASTNPYFKNRWNIIRIITKRVGKNNREVYAHTVELEKHLRAVYRTSYCNRFPIVRTIENDVIEVICTGDDPRELVRPLRIALEELRADISSVLLAGNLNLSICCDKEFEEEDYYEPMEDRFSIRIRYKHFQAFGSAYNNANIL